MGIRSDTFPAFPQILSYPPAPDPNTDGRRVSGKGICPCPCPDPRERFTEWEREPKAEEGEGEIASNVRGVEERWGEEDVLASAATDAEFEDEGPDVADTSFVIVRREGYVIGQEMSFTVDIAAGAEWGCGSAVDYPDVVSAESGSRSSGVACDGGEGGRESYCDWTKAHICAASRSPTSDTTRKWGWE
ncbi:unnamed protein product [Peniophora sp. CBMAI 1063]|nr:unnamed protein product [Peniophora sp. CBMAI 1063]